MCDCGFEIDSTEHFLLRCPFFAVERNDIFKRLHIIKSPILNLEKNILANVLLFGSDKYEKVINVANVVIKSTITYLKSTERFERPLIDQ